MKKNRIRRVLGLLPSALSLEIVSILSGRAGGAGELGEIRLLAGGRCSLIHKRQAIALHYAPSEEEMEEILRKVCCGGTYACRDTVKCGFVPMGDGVRVGVSGTARYDEGRLVGISRVRTLVFRFPLCRCDFGEDILKVYRQGIGRGLLIYSPPGIGKTTALRHLASIISKERRLCVIDERGEFSGDDLPCASVLSGYEKALGIEIALRTHSPEIIMIDEIGAEEAESLSSVFGAGVPIIASAHGGGVDDLVSRSATRALICSGFFDVFVGISIGDGGYELRKTAFSEIQDHKHKAMCER